MCLCGLQLIAGMCIQTCRCMLRLWRLPALLVGGMRVREMRNVLLLMSVAVEDVVSVSSACCLARVDSISGVQVS